MHVASRGQARRLAAAHAGDLRDLRPAVARRPLADGAPLRRAPRERSRELRALRRALADARARRRGRLGAAGGERRAGPRGRSSPSASTRTYTPGLRGGRVAQGQDAPPARSSSIGGWLPGQGPAPRERSARCCSACTTTTARCATSGASAAASASRSSSACSGCSRRCGDATRRSAPASAPPREAVFCEPRLVAEVRFSRVDRGRQPAPPRPTRACARTRPPRRSCARRAAALAGGGAAPARRERPTPTPAASSAIARAVARQRRLATVGGTELDALQPRQGPLPARRASPSATLIDYYAAIAPVAARRTSQGRALTVTRWPDGVRGQVVLPEAGARAPARLGARPRRVPSAQQADRLHARRRPADARVAREPRGARAARAARARAARRERPTALVFDLDPGAPAGVLECCARGAAAAGHVREPRPARASSKTSGSKGLQVYLPLNDAAIALRARRSPSRRAVAELLERDEPELVVSRMTQGAPDGQGADRLEPERRATRRRCASTRCARPRARPSRRRSTGRRLGGALAAGDPADAGLRGRRTCWSACAERGDLFAPVLSLVQRLPAI